MSNVLSLQDISFGYNESLLFNNFSLEFKQGFTSLIGPNGSGKSTIMRLITGMEKPRSGKILICDQNISKLTANERAKLFTAIFQGQNFPFPFTCMELVSMGRYPYRKGLGGLSDEDCRIVQEAMEITETIQFSDRMITDISGGEQQRVLLAAALAQETKVIFLDEAFSALDISHRINMMKLLKNRVQQKGIAVISIIHDLNLAYRYSDMVCVLQDGKIIKCGTPQQTMTKPCIESVFKIKIEEPTGISFY